MIRAIAHSPLDSSDGADCISPHPCGVAQIAATAACKKFFIFVPSDHGKAREVRYTNELAGRVPKGRVDFVTEVACHIPLDAVSDLLGVPPEDRKQVLALTNMITVPLYAGKFTRPESFEVNPWGAVDAAQDVAPLSRRQCAVASGIDAGAWNQELLGADG